MTLIRGVRLAATVLSCGLLLAPALQGQDTKRAYANRAELDSTLSEIDQVLNSSGYSSRLKDAKRREARLIRQRLTEGDLQVGDQVSIAVEGVPQFTDTFTVAAGRVVVLPGGLTIPLQGVLRSEAERYFTEQIGKVVRNPTVHVQPEIRLSILGQVNRPGFYHLPADMLVSDAIMSAGGLQGQTDPGNTQVRRGGQEIITPADFKQVLAEGLTLDQLNLRAGDELVVERIKGRGVSATTVFAVLGSLSSVAYLMTRLFSNR